MIIRWEALRDEAIPLRDLATATSLLELLASATDEDPVQVSYTQKGSRFVLGHCGSGWTAPPEARELAVASRCALFLVKQFDIDTSLPVVAHQLHDQESQLAAMRGILDRTSGPLSIGVGVESDTDLSGKRAAIVLPMSARVGENVLAAIVAWNGKASWDPHSRKVSIDHGETTLLEKESVPLADWNRPAHVTRASLLADEMAKSGDYDFVAAPDDPAE